MTTPSLLQTVGFERGKIGSGEKEVGYQINQSSLCSLIGGTLVCFAFMAVLVIFMVFDVHLEKKNFHKEIRVEEHHAASKLAKVQMELWSQYRSDIQESHEATNLLKSLDGAYNAFQPKFKDAVTELAGELHLEPTKAAKFADKILHIVADMQQDNTKHAKHLIDHLVNSGKKSVLLERRVDHEIAREVGAEKKHMEEDAIEGINVDALEHDGGPNASIDEEDPLKKVLEDFFYVYHNFDGEFGGNVREKFMDTANPQHGQIMELYKKVKSSEPPSSEELSTELAKIDLVGLGAGLGSGRVLPIEDIVEELSMIPSIPHNELKELEKSWRAGEKDSVLALQALYEWTEKGVLPEGWLQSGVNKYEDEIEREEDKED